MNHKRGAFSTIELSDELACQVIPLVGKHVSQFSSVEDRFFTEGDALATGDADLGNLDDMTATRTPRRWLTRNSSLVGGTIGALVIAGTVLLVRSGGHAADVLDPALVATTLPPSSAAAAPQPVPAAEPSPSAAAKPAAPSPAPAAVPTESPVPTAAAANDSEVPPAPAPTHLGASPPPTQASAGAVAGSFASPAQEPCKKALSEHRNKDILIKCAAAFAADPQSAETAIILAKVEFDCGHTPQALDWAKKAIALDADRADAYVFLGGAEQAAGHQAAAKAAYKRYLQLAPQGRYAADLRAVLGSL